MELATKDLHTKKCSFFWIECHIITPTIVTVISAQNSGASYLNRVELQNGCHALAHANLFIPSTLEGSCLDVKTGNVDPEKFKLNMELATEVYIGRVNDCPCGEGTINLFAGADSRDRQELRKKLLVFLKGSKREWRALQQSNPEDFAYFEDVWAVRCKHMAKDLSVGVLLSAYLPPPFL